MSLREKIKLSALGVGAPVPTASFGCQRDPVCELRVGLNPELFMSSSRDAFLGHACVSPLPSGADHLATEEFQRVGEPSPKLGKTSQGESTFDA